MSQETSVEKKDEIKKLLDWVYNGSTKENRLNRKYDCYETYKKEIVRRI